MSARDDYPTLRFNAVELGYVEATMALDEIDVLRAEVQLLAEALRSLGVAP